MLIEMLLHSVIRCFEFARRVYYRESTRYETDGNINPIPFVDSSPLMLTSATRLARMIVFGETNCELVVTSYIRQIRSANERLNAVADEQFAKALATARKLDSKLRAYKGNRAEILTRKPFCGVPITVKESIAVEGLCCCIGLVDGHGDKYRMTANVVKAMQNAGAIVLCSSTVPEACMWVETSSLPHGRTNNPYDLRRTCGGSSGGEAALLGSASSLIGLGTDLSGSIRTPAAWCGIYGHKPTQGWVSTQGTYPALAGPVKDFASPGPMTRYAEDLLPMLKVLTGNEPCLKLDTDVELSKLKLFYMESYGSDRPIDVCDQSSVVTLVVKELTNLGCTAQHFECNAFENPFDLCFGKFVHVGTVPFDNAFRPGGINVFFQLVGKLLGISKFTVYASLLPTMEKLYRFQCSEKHAADLLELNALERQLEEILGRDGLLVLPAQRTSAPFHHGTYVSPKRYFSTPGIWNVLNLPATVCPVGPLKDALPQAVMLVAGRNQDRLCLAVARHLERALGGWTPPCRIESNLE